MLREANIAPLFSHVSIQDANQHQSLPCPPIPPTLATISAIPLLTSTATASYSCGRRQPSCQGSPHGRKQPSCQGSPLTSLSTVLSGLKGLPSLSTLLAIPLPKTLDTASPDTVMPLTNNFLALLKLLLKGELENYLLALLGEVWTKQVW